MAVVALVRCRDGRCRRRRIELPAPSRDSVQIAASVGEGAHNRLEDVRVIQDALNQVAPDSGGPAPPLKVDGLCYGKTLAAIRKFQKEACGFKWPDGRVDPGGKTQSRLKEFFVPANPYTMPRVYLMLPQARLWIMVAMRVLGDAQFHLGGLRTFAGRFALVSKYFHLDQLRPPQARVALAKIRSTFVSMETCIGHSSPLTTPGSGYFQEDPRDNEASAYTFSGGFTRRSRTHTTPPMSHEDNYLGLNQREDTIFICPRVLNTASNEFYTKVIVHELAHFCGPPPGADEIGDHGYRDHRVPDSKDSFFKLSPHMAIRTADCYSEFAGEAYLRREPPGR